jgi:glucan 1,3-beta-glucosidase
MKSSSVQTFNPSAVQSSDSNTGRPWVRGVNVGGWLVMERYITPYQFAITDCHLKGDFCWYPGQLTAPDKDSPEYKLCDLYQCQPVRPVNVFGTRDFPMDEWTLAEAFEDKSIAADWLEYHLDNFVSLEDLQKVKAAGATHIRVPIPHFMLGDVVEGEPWVVGARWKYFVRLCHWARETGLQVWPDIHTAPGSQNGFDNSGRSLTGITCKGWSDNATHVERSLQAIRDITQQAVKDQIDDVLTGFGLLNEPFKDCDRAVVEKFMEDGLKVVHDTLGKDTSVYVSDLFLAKTFNDGEWWLDPVQYNNTYLDSHYYQVFAEQPRALSPKQHVAYVCQNEYRDVTSCCYEHQTGLASLFHFRPKISPTRNTSPSQGVKRMVGEWSAAYDTLPVAMLNTIMDSIAETGVAPHLHRHMSSDRKDFLSHFVQAQMVAYEAVDAGVSGAWFYWTLKMEGGAFAEWDFLRGVSEGWIPQIPALEVSSQSIHGTCYDILLDTDDSMSIVDEFPDPTTLDPNNWQGVAIDDDVVVSHGDSLLHGGGRQNGQNHHHPFAHWFLFVTVAATLAIVSHRYFSKTRRKQQQYSSIETVEPSLVV